MNASDTYDIETPDESFSDNLCTEFGQAVIDGKIISPIVKDELSDIEYIREKIFDLDKKGNRIGLDIRNISLMLKAENNFITTGEHTLTIYRYYEGVYLPDGEQFIKEKVQEWTSGLHLTNSKVSEIIGHIQRSTYKDRKIFDNNPNLICVKNGILNLETKELIPHTPDKYFNTKISIEWNPEAKCEQVYKFLNEVIDVTYIPTIQEYIGFCLYKRYFIKKSLILVGERDSGKTTFIKLLIAFIDEKNCSGESLHRILTDKFSTINLYGKLLNYYDDLSFKDVNDTGSFKIVCGGGYISGEKKFGDRFNFINYAKLVFATNRISGVKDSDDEAYYSRWIPIPFEKQFNSDNRDLYLTDKITSKDELEGLLVWAIEGLQRLRNKGYFSDTRTPLEIKNFMEKYSDSVSVFIQEAITREDGNWISKDDLYQVYSEFSENKGLSRVTKEKFGRDILSKCTYVLSSQKEVNGKKGVTGWLNIGLNKGFNTFSPIITYNNINENTNYNSLDVSINKVFNPLSSNALSFDLLQMFLIDKPEISITDLILKGFTDSQLDEWKEQGMIFESKSGYIRLT